MTITELINEQTKAIAEHLKNAAYFEEQMKTAKNEGELKDLKRESMFHLEEAAWLREQQIKLEKQL